MRLECDGISLHCTVEGPERAPWITLSHAVATNLEMWDGVMPFLAQHYRVLRYDLRGHGRSGASTGDYSLPLLCTDVICLLDRLKIERTHFVGLSLGGMLGLGLALDHPERLLSLVVCDARASRTDDYTKSWDGRIASVRRDGIDAIVNSSVERWFTPEFRSGEVAAVERIRGMVRQTSPEGYCGAAAALKTLDYEARLPEIKVPTLFLVGEQDSGAPLPVMRSMHASVKGSRFVVIPRAGHLSAVERPEFFSTAVLGFLTEQDIVARFSSPGGTPEPLPKGTAV